MTQITLSEKESQLARRKAELGYTGRDYVAPNSGARRTPAKRELLRTIRREAEARGTVPVFAAAIG
jgi:hypothetical protein